VAVMSPFALIELLWPDTILYRQQRELIQSVEDNTETIVVAGNQLGKDYSAGLIALLYFLRHPVVRIITTSVAEKHLDVLWGEIRHFVQTSRSPLDYKQGGPLKLMESALEMYKVDPKTGVQCPTSRMLGMVSEKAEKFAGWHAPATLCIFDEASSVDDMAYSQSRTWAKRRLLIGNPHSRGNYFFRAVKEGDIVDKDHTPKEGEPQRCFRKVMQIRAVDSPNVKLGLEEVARGLKPSNRVLVPGVLTYEQYKERRATWGAMEQCIGLDAEFWEGDSVMLVPAPWLAEAADHHDYLVRNRVKRTPRAIGVDTASGGDETVFTCVDEHGVIEQIGRRTPDTNTIIGDIIAFGKKHNVPATQWVFDAGGGGREHADRLRYMGYKVRTVGFGESATPEPRQAKIPLSERREAKDAKRAYVNRRAEMYGDVRMLLDPTTDSVPADIYRDLPFSGFAIPADMLELRRQLGGIPYHRDEEGRMYLPAKSKRSRKRVNEQTLDELLGCSPDRADSLVLAVHGMLRASAGFVVKPMW